MKILVIATGGTIGSSFDGVSINVTDEKCAVAERYAAQHDDLQFHIEKPLNILSERLSSDDLNTLAGVLYQADFSAYDGVIVTVGSDNLAHLASFIGLICGGCGASVCVVATNLILTDPMSNGEANFSCAVELIRAGHTGVFVPYRNGDGVMYVHSAFDIRQADMSEDFHSFHGAYAVYENGTLRERRAYVRHGLPAVFDRDHLPKLGDSVLLIHPYPLQDYARIKTDGVRAVLHTLYHSATLDSRRAEDFLEALGDIPFFIASLRSDRKRYATTEEIVRAGAIPLYDISPECAYMKLLFASAQEELSIRDFMEVDG